MNPWDGLPGFEGEPSGVKPWDGLLDQPKSAAPEKSPGVTDYAKSAISGALSGTGMIAQGGGELLARGVNAAAGTELRAENPFKGAIDWLEQSKTEGAKSAEAGTQISGSLFDPSTWSFGSNPTLSGLALQGMNAIGQFAPNLAVAIGSMGASVPAQLAIGATVGGMQALGGGADEERAKFQHMGHAELMASSTLYREMVGKGIQPDVAKNAVAEAAALGGGLGNAIPSAAEGAFENFLIGALTKGTVKIPSFGKGLLGRVAVGAAGGAATGGTEEALEQMGQNIGSNLAIGGNRPVTADTLQQFVMGALAEGVAGGGAGALQHTQASPPAPAVPSPKTSEQATADAVAPVLQAQSLDEAIQAASEGAAHVSDVEATVTSGLVGKGMDQAIARAERAVAEDPAYRDLEAQKERELSQIQQARREAGIPPESPTDMEPVPSETQIGGEKPQTAMQAAWGRLMLQRMEALQRAKGEPSALSQQSSGEVDVQPETGNGEAVGGGNAQPEVSTGEGQAQGADRQAPEVKLFGRPIADLTDQELAAAAKNHPMSGFRHAAEAELARRAESQAGPISPNPGSQLPTSGTTMPESGTQSEAPAQLPAVKQRLFVQRGHERFEVGSLEEASKKWTQFSLAAMKEGAGGESLGGALIVDQSGKEVARISQNGKVWPPGEWAPGVKPLVGEPFKASTPAPVEPSSTPLPATIFGKPLADATDKQLQAALKHRNTASRQAAQAEIDRRQAVRDAGTVKVAPEDHEMLRLMAQQSGHIERGGKAIRQFDERGLAFQGDVIGKTAWAGQPDFAKGFGMTPDEIQAALEKAIAGQPMGKKQRQVVQAMQEELVETRKNLAEAEAVAVQAEGQKPDDWNTMSEEDKDAELDKIFGADSGQADQGISAQGAEGGARDRQSALEQASERQPGEDDEVAPQASPLGIEPEPVEQSAANPTRPPNERWFSDRGSMPGEPMMLLDVKNDDIDTAKAAITEREIEGKGVLYDATDSEGNLLGTAETVEQAAAIAEKAFPREKSQGETAKVAPGGFDSEAFEKKRADAIKASREAGNVHLDKVPPYVETMRGKDIFYVHDPKVKGTIRTVDNRGNVYVNWADAYSAEKEMASETKDGKKKVMQSSLGPTDMKDYALAPQKRPALELKAETSADLAAKAEKEAAAAAAEKKATEAAEAKRKADAEAKQPLELTGSDRQADANPNQSGLFSRAANVAPRKGPVTSYDIPIDLKIELPVFVEETGETEHITVDARKAFRDSDKRVNRLQALMNCLRT